MRHKRCTQLNPTKSTHRTLTGLKFGAVLLFGLGLTGLQAQTMYVEQSNGTQTAFSLNNIQKMNFSAGNLTITKIDNSVGFFVLNELRYLNFSDTTTGLEELFSAQSQMLNAYPNPVSNTLNIGLTGKNLGTGTLSLINFEGKTIHSQKTNNTNLITMNISHLPEGIYLCLYKNASEVRTVKIIKQ